MSESRTVDELIEGLIHHTREASQLVRPGDGEYHLRTLLKIRDWAYAQQPHQVGDRVHIAQPINFNKAFGWRPYAEHLQVGCLGTVEGIHFNGAHDHWVAEVRMDGYDGLFSLGQNMLASHTDRCVACPQDERERP